MKKAVLWGICSLFLFACSGKKTQGQAETTDTIDSIAVDMHTAQNSLDWNGTYNGTFPCADCEGIKTQLTLNSDSTYTLMQEYLGKTEKIQETGKIQWKENGKSIILTSKEGYKQYFNIYEGRAVLCNAEGEESQSELAAYYILKKQM